MPVWQIFSRGGDFQTAAINFRSRRRATRGSVACDARVTASASEGGVTSLAQPSRATVRASLDDHENDVVECVMEAVANVEGATQSGSRNMVNRRD